MSFYCKHDSKLCSETLFKASWSCCYAVDKPSKSRLHKELHQSGCIYLQFNWMIWLDGRRKICKTAVKRFSFSFQVYFFIATKLWVVNILRKLQTRALESWVLTLSCEGKQWHGWLNRFEICKNNSQRDVT